MFWLEIPHLDLRVGSVDWVNSGDQAGCVPRTDGGHRADGGHLADGGHRADGGLRVGVESTSILGIVVESNSILGIGDESGHPRSNPPPEGRSPALEAWPRRRSAIARTFSVV